MEMPLEDQMTYFVYIGTLHQHGYLSLSETPCEAREKRWNQHFVFSMASDKASTRSW